MQRMKGKKMVKEMQERVVSPLEADEVHIDRIYLGREYNQV
jgi:hypothetical protein